LYAAPERGHEADVTPPLEGQAKVDSRTPRPSGAEKGHKDVVKLLLGGLKLRLTREIYLAGHRYHMLSGMPIRLLSNYLSRRHMTAASG
jgi:hypothetical protein